MLAKLTPTTPEEKRAPPLDLSPTCAVCLWLEWLDEQEVEDKMRGNMVFLPLFAGILIFLIHLFHVHLTDIQTRGKRMVRFKITGAKSQN